MSVQVLLFLNKPFTTNLASQYSKECRNES